jgi:hypothetical protein
MEQLMKGPQSLFTIRDALKKDPVPWEEIGKKTQMAAVAGRHLGKFKPPRGSAESWAKLTGEFATNVGELDKAVQAKDKNTTQATYTTLMGSCKACHDAHKTAAMPNLTPPGPIHPVKQ